MKSQEKHKFWLGVLFLTAAIWGTGFIATKMAVDVGYSSSFMMLTRFLISALVLIPFLRKEFRGLSKTSWGGGFLVGLVLFLGYAFQTEGIRSCTPSMNALLTATSILFLPFAVWLLFKQRPARSVFICCAIAFIGILLLTLDLHTMKFHFGIGEILTLLGAFLFAWHSALIAWFAQRGSPTMIHFMQMLFACLLSGIWFIFSDGRLELFRPSKGMLLILWLALPCTLLAFWLQSMAQRYVHPSQSSMILSTESLFASLFSVLFGFDTLRLNLLLGGGILLSAIFSLELLERRAAKEKKAEGTQESDRTQLKTETP